MPYAKNYFLTTIAALLSIPQIRRRTAPVFGRRYAGPSDIGEVALSPDGKTIVFSVATIDLPANKTITRLMRISSAGGTPETLAGAPEGASSIRWSPNGERLAFIAAHDKRLAFIRWTYPSGKATRICDYHRSNSFLPHSGNMLACRRQQTDRNSPERWNPIRRAGSVGRQSHSV